MNPIEKKTRRSIVLTELLLLTLGIALTINWPAFARDSETSAWTDTDVGTAPMPGNAQSDGNGGYFISSSGPDIWGTNDAFNYLYQPLGTNGEIVAELSAMQGGGKWAKAGVMIRESLDATSRYAAMLLTTNGTSFQWRLTAMSGNGVNVGETNVAFPRWIKIARNGDWVGGFDSPDGTNWTLVDWQTIDGLAPEVYVGLAVTSANNQGLSAAAQFDQINVGAAELSQTSMPVMGEGDGLMGSYYDNRHLYGQPVTNRVDQQLDFNFYRDLSHYPNATAMLGTPKMHEFSACWAGEVLAQYTEPYTFYTRSDDGVRVWLNEQLIIDDWRCHSPTNLITSAPVNLVAGQRYLLRVEYFQNFGGAQMHLGWSSPSTSPRTIPQDQLYSEPTMDANGLPICWEEHYFGQTNIDPNADADGDGLSNIQEYQRHTDPTNPQTYGIPDTWGDGDVGDWNSTGGTRYSNGVFSVGSAGSDIWGGADSFHYVFQALGTNGQIVARVLGIQATNQYAKAGVMVRETLDQDARNVMFAMSKMGRLAFQWREATGQNTQQPRFGHWSGTNWLKLVRNEDWLGGYVSGDGTNWTLVDWTIIPGLARQVYVGLAVSARNGKQAGCPPAAAQFDQVRISPADPSSVLNVVEGAGDGLMANFRNDSLLYLPGFTNRVDPNVNLIWMHRPPLGQLNPDGYGVCWAGEVQAQLTEPYTFSVTTRQEDWVRVWINDQLVVNGWRSWHTNGDLKGAPISLVAGQHYLIRVEMYNNEGHGMAVLNWSSPSMSERIVPQYQLYSQPEMDPDGSGLPVIWEQIYFGQTGVDPNGDPDNDGLSNLQEYRYHTNPTNSDTDGDGIPDAWEVTHGLDPQYPEDAGLDYDNSGFSNLQDYLLGLNPLNVDVNGDGLPDWFEEEYLGTGPSLVCTNQISVALTVNGSQGTSYLGNWQVDGTDIFCLDRRGGVDFNLPITNADKYVLNLVGTQNQANSIQTTFSLLLGIDNQTLEHYTLNAGYGTNGTVELVLPYLQAGAHTLHVFWDGFASDSNLRIKQVKLLSVSGQTNQQGIKTWAAQMVSDESGLDRTNSIIGSYTSPMCLEGRDPFPTMMALTDNQNALSPVATSDGCWYVNVPLSVSNQTILNASYQNGALTQMARLQWLPVNLLTATNLTIREGDSLLFNALPPNETNGSLQVVIGGNTYSSQTTQPVPYRFTSAGNYLVTGTYTSQSGQNQSASVTVDVVQQRLPQVEPCAWVGMSRPLILTNLAPEAVLQADSRLTCYLSGTNADGAVRLTLGIDANEPRTILARLGTNGPILDSTQVQGFDVWSGDQAYTKILQIYPDGSQLLEMLMISSPVETNVTFVVQPIVSGIMFDDGTTLKILNATNFDALGQCPIRFIRPASAKTSVCNQIQGYQGNYQIGYRH